ncbi:MAG: hypothetical protein R3F30_00835 [Planctomycetota bacterium]
MGFLRRMDFTTGMIYVGVLLCLGLGGWHLHLRGELTRAKDAFADLDRQLPEIEARLKSIMEMKRESEAAANSDLDNTDPRSYFQSHLHGARFALNDYQISIGSEQTRSFRIGKLTKRAKETEAEIRFKDVNGRGTGPFHRQNIFKAVFDIEAHSNRWKLRELVLKNEDVKASRSKKGYPDELSDRWEIDRLKFVRRDPDK